MVYLIFCVGCVALQPSKLAEEQAFVATAQNPYRRSFAVVVGVNNYLMLPALDYAINDASSVRDVLISEFGFKTDNILFLTDPRLKEVRDQIHEFVVKNKMQADDSFVFYFAGHGLTNNNGDGYLALKDSWTPDLDHTSLGMDELVSDLDALPCRHKAVIIDACYSGAMFRSVSKQTSRRDSTAIERPGEPAGLDNFGYYINHPAFVGISAGRLQRVADGLGSGRHSVFTASLLGVLADCADSVRSGHEFTFRQMATRVEERVGNFPGSSQIPNWGSLGDGDGDFVFSPVIDCITPAERKEFEIARARYGAAIGAANRALLEGRYSFATAELESQIPMVGSRTDFRGFEWYYLWKQIHGESARYSLSQTTDPSLGILAGPVVDGGPDFKSEGLKGLNSSPVDSFSDGGWAITLGLDGGLQPFAESLSHGLEAEWRGNGQQSKLRIRDPRTFPFVQESNQVEGGNVWLRSRPAGEWRKLPIGTIPRPSVLTFSDDGKDLAAVADDGRVWIWNTPVGALSFKGSARGYVLNAAFDSKNALIIATLDQPAAGSAPGELNGAIWALPHRPGQFIKVLGLNRLEDIRLVKHDDTIVAADNQGLVLGISSSDGKVRWSHRVSSAPSALAASPTEPRVAIGLVNGSVEELSSNSGLPIRVLRGHASMIERLVYARDGSYLASYDADKLANMWWRDGRDDGERRVPLPLSSESYSISSDGSEVVVPGPEWGKVSMIDVVSGRMMETLDLPPGAVGQIHTAFVRDGNNIAVARTGGRSPGRFYVFDRSRRLWSEVPPSGNVADPNVLQVGKRVTALMSAHWAGGGGDLNVTSPLSGVSTRSFTRASCASGAMILSPDENWLVTGSKCGHNILAWDLRNGKLATLSTGFSTVTALIGSPASQLMAGLADGTVELWRPNEETPFATVFGDGLVTSLALSWDGRTIASGFVDGTISLIGQGGEPLLAFSPPDAQPNPDQYFLGEYPDAPSVLLSSDGVRLVSVSSKGGIVVRTAASEADVLDWMVFQSKRQEHRESVFDAQAMLVREVWAYHLRNPSDLTIANRALEGLRACLQMNSFPYDDPKSPDRPGCAQILSLASEQVQHEYRVALDFQERSRRASSEVKQLSDSVETQCEMRNGTHSLLQYDCRQEALNFSGKVYNEVWRCAMQDRSGLALDLVRLQCLEQWLRTNRGNR